MFGFVKNLDVFKGDLPQFNISGKTKVNTWMGACCSIIIFMICFAFSLLKLENLVDRSNPSLTELTETVDADTTFSLGSDEFTVAFALSKFNGEVLQYDPRYVRWIVRIWESKDNKRTERFYPLHLCNDEDLDKFHTAENDYVAKEVQMLKENNNLFCLHPEVQNFNLQGSWLTTADYATYDVWLTSCTSQFKLFDGSEQGADESCIWDQQEVLEYLGSGFFLTVYHNQ